MRSTRRALTAFGLSAPLALGGAAALWAQDGELNPDELFASSKAAYAEKHYGKSLTDLQLLYGAVSKLRIEQIKAVLPAPPAGWKAEEAEGEAMGMLAMGAGLNVKREYTKPGTDENASAPRVSVEILSNSPLVGMIAPMLSNPAMMAGQEGVSIITVKGRKGLLEWHKGQTNGTLKILLGDNTTLLTVTGNDCPKTDVSDVFAKALDMEKIQKVIEE
jgi:hypothetical protein